MKSGFCDAYLPYCIPRPMGAGRSYRLLSPRYSRCRRVYSLFSVTAGNSCCKCLVSWTKGINPCVYWFDQSETSDSIRRWGKWGAISTYIWRIELGLGHQSFWLWTKGYRFIWTAIRYIRSSVISQYWSVLTTDLYLQNIEIDSCKKKLFGE